MPRDLTTERDLTRAEIDATRQLVTDPKVPAGTRRILAAMVRDMDGMMQALAR